MPIENIGCMMWSSFATLIVIILISSVYEHFESKILNRKIKKIDADLVKKIRDRREAKND